MAEVSARNQNKQKKNQKTNCYQKKQGRFLQLRCLRQVRETRPHRWRQTRLPFPPDQVLPMNQMHPVSPADLALLRDREDRQALSVRSFHWLLRGQWGLEGLQVPYLRAYPPGPELPGGPVGQLDP